MVIIISSLIHTRVHTHTHKKGIKVKNINSVVTQVPNMERKPSGRDETILSGWIVSLGQGQWHVQRKCTKLL